MFRPLPRHHIWRMQEYHKYACVKFDKYIAHALIGVNTELTIVSHST